MKCLGLLAILLAVAAAKSVEKSVVKMLYGDEYKNYRFEEHKLVTPKKVHFVLIVKDLDNERECHVVDVDSHFNTLLEDGRFVKKLSKQLYQYIRWVRESEQEWTNEEFFDFYQDKMASKECENHRIFYLPAYSPSFQLEDADKPIADDNDGEIGPDDHWDAECDPNDAKAVGDFFDKMIKDMQRQGLGSDAQVILDNLKFTLPTETTVKTTTGAGSVMA